MSLPEWAWEPRFSPKLPVVVPATGAAIWPVPQPAPVVTGAAAGAGAGAGAGLDTAWVFVTALRFSSASVDVGPVVVRGAVAGRFDDDFCFVFVTGFGAAADGPSTPAAGAV